MIEIKEREGDREREKQTERYRQGGRDERESKREIERETDVRDIQRESEKERQSAISQKNYGKSPKRRNKAQRKVDCKNYDAITIRKNYDTKLSATSNYEEKL